MTLSDKGGIKIKTLYRSICLVLCFFLIFSVFPFEQKNVISPVVLKAEAIEPMSASALAIYFVVTTIITTVGVSLAVDEDFRESLNRDFFGFFTGIGDAFSNAYEDLSSLLNAKSSTAAREFLKAGIFGGDGYTEEQLNSLTDEEINYLFQNGLDVNNYRIALTPSLWDKITDWFSRTFLNKDGMYYCTVDLAMPKANVIPKGYDWRQLFPLWLSPHGQQFSYTWQGPMMTFKAYTELSPYGGYRVKYEIHRHVQGENLVAFKFQTYMEVGYAGGDVRLYAPIIMESPTYKELDVYTTKIISGDTWHTYASDGIQLWTGEKFETLNWSSGRAFMTNPWRAFSEPGEYENLYHFAYDKLYSGSGIEIAIDDTFPGDITEEEWVAAGRTVNVPRTKAQADSWTKADAITTEALADYEWDNVKDRLDFNNSLINKFPFCIPFDVYRAFSTLAAPAKEPIFIIPFKMDNFGINEEIEIDLTMFDVVWTILRWFLSVYFVYILAVGTKKLLGGHG